MWRIYRSVHSSWILALAAAGFVSGVSLALVFRVGFLWAVIGALFVAAALTFRRAWVLPVAAAGSVLLGVGYGSAHYVERAVYSRWFGQVVTVSGRIKEDPSKSSSGSISLQIDSVFVAGASQPGTIFVSVRTVSAMTRGDVITGSGQMKAGFANFPASVSLFGAPRIQRYQFSDVGREVRDWFAESVRQRIPEPQASLGVGFLTGQKSALPGDFADALKVAGLTHIVVASGYNLTILVRMARKLLQRASKYLSAVSAGVMILAFMAMTGLSPSMTRAGLVSGISLISGYYGYGFHPLVLLPIAAAVTVALQPSYVWGDMGWQLSFSAFAGVMIVAPLLQAYFFGNKEPGIFRQILGETIAAHFVTVPIIALSFGTMSNVAIIANLLVVPLVPLAMLSVFITGLGVIFSLPFIGIIATPTTWLLTYMVQVATTVADLDWAQTTLDQVGWWWLGYLALLVFACTWMWRKTRYNFRQGEALMG